MILVAVFLLLTIPVIVAQRGGTAAAFDQEWYHLPTVEKFARELPVVDVVDVRTPTGPAYHLVLAIGYRFLSSERVVLQSLSAVWALVFLVLIFRGAAQLAGPWTALALTLPLAFSHYFLQSAGWINTDNAGFLFAFVALSACVSAVTSSTRLSVAGIAAMLAVLVRQLHLWLAGVIVFAGAAGAWLTPASGPERLDGMRRWRPLVVAGIAAAPAVVVVGLLAYLWGGLLPPRFADALDPSLAVFAFALALFGIFGTPYLLAVGGSVSATVRTVLTDRTARLAAAAGALTALVPVPDDLFDPLGRTGGGLWLAVEKTPLVAGRSPLLAVLAAWGAVVVLQWWRVHSGQASRREALVLLVALLAFVTAHVPNDAIYQKYFEPMFLVLLILLAGLALRDQGETITSPPAAKRIVALGLLTAVQLIGCVVVVYFRMSTSPGLG